MQISPATVYNSLFLKADQRTAVQVAGGWTYRTTAGPHIRLDDIVVIPGGTLHPDLTGGTGQLLLLPIVGGVLLSTSQESEKALLPGFVYAIPEAEAADLTLVNPFDNERVNVLLVQAAVPAAACPAVAEWELPLTVKNQLVTPAGHVLPVQVGLYDSRVKDHLAPVRSADFTLCYVLNGSFEIEDRLAEHRDALLLWETPAIEFESLSETAIVFCLSITKP